MLSGDNSILQKATDAKNNSDNAQIKEKIRLAYHSALTKDIISENGELTKATLENELQNEFGNDAEIKKVGDEWGIFVNDIEYERISKLKIATQESWEEVKDSNGNVTIQKADKSVIGLKIGDIIDYKPTQGIDVTDTEITQVKIPVADAGDGPPTQTFDVTNYTGENDKWQLLGVENGKLILVSSKLIGSTEYSNGLVLAKRSGYKNGPNILNQISALYGKGLYAESARSITVEDINKITGFNPECQGVKNPTAQDIASGKKWPGGPALNEYGNKITYSWDGTNYPAYTSTNGNEGSTNFPHTNGFYWFDGTDWQKSEYTTTTGKICDITTTYYQYYPETLTQFKSDIVVGITQSTAEYQLLFKSDLQYWLASRSVDCGTSFGLRFIRNGRVVSGDNSDSDGNEDNGAGNIRSTPISNIKI